MGIETFVNNMHFVQAVFLVLLNHANSIDGHDVTPVPTPPNLSDSLSQDHVIEIYRQLAKLETLVNVLNQNLAEKDRLIRKLEDKMLLQEFQNNLSSNQGNLNSIKTLENKVDAVFDHLKQVQNETNQCDDRNSIIIPNPVVKPVTPEVRVFVRHTGTVTANGIFKFDDIQMNIGDGYDRFTGYFTI